MERPYDTLQALGMFPWRSGSKPKTHGILQILQTIIRQLTINWIKMAGTPVIAYQWAGDPTLEEGDIIQRSYNLFYIISRIQ